MKLVHILWVPQMYRDIKKGQGNESPREIQDSVEDCHGVKQFIQHLEFESKQQSIEWRHTIFKETKKFKKVPVGEKIMAAEFLF